MRPCYLLSVGNLQEATGGALLEARQRRCTFALMATAFSSAAASGVGSGGGLLLNSRLCSRSDRRHVVVVARRPFASCSTDRVIMSADDLLIVGPGVLGQRVASQWIAAHPTASIVGETRSTNSHAALIAAGISPTISSTREQSQYSQVVFCAPPRGNPDYPGAVSAAAARTAPGGVFIFTSSGGAYADTGGVLTEASPSADGARAAGLIAAESAALGVSGGLVVRLAGLYTLERGAHNHWLTSGNVAGSRSGLVNLLHYDDAAGIVVAALEAGRRDGGVGKSGMRMFLGCDGSPMSREDICEAARVHPLFADYDMPKFDEAGGGSTKRYDNSATRNALGWSPSWNSFHAYMLGTISK
jgi:hypothetical protein